MKIRQPFSPLNSILRRWYFFSKHLPLVPNLYTFTWKIRIPELQQLELNENLAENRLTFANEKDPSLASCPLFGGVLRVLSNELAKDSVCLIKEKRIIINANSKCFDHCNLAPSSKKWTNAQIKLYFVKLMDIFCALFWRLNENRNILLSFSHLYKLIIMRWS